MERERHRVAGRVQPPADADQLRPARPDRAGASRSRSGAGCSTSAARASTWPARSWASGSARSFPACPASSTSCFAVVAGALAGALLAGHRRDPEGDRRHPRGDLDDHAQLDHGLGGGVPVRARRAAPERHAAVRPGLERRRGQGEAGDLLGRPGAPGPARRLLRRAGRARRLLAHRSTGRRSATRCARSASTPRRRATAASRWRGTTSSRWRSPAPSPASRARSTSLGWQYRINTNDVQISSLIAFTGIAVALLGRNKAVGVGLAALLFAALTTGTSTRNLDPEIFRPELAVEPDHHDPGARHPLRRRGRPDPLPAQRAQARPAACGDESRRVIERADRPAAPWTRAHRAGSGSCVGDRSVLGGAAAAEDP